MKQDGTANWETIDLDTSLWSLPTQHQTSRSDDAVDAKELESLDSRARALLQRQLGDTSAFHYYLAVDLSRRGFDADARKHLACAARLETKTQEGILVRVYDLLLNLTCCRDGCELEEAVSNSESGDIGEIQARLAESIANYIARELACLEGDDGYLEQAKTNFRQVAIHGSRSFYTIRTRVVTSMLDYLEMVREAGHVSRNEPPWFGKLEDETRSWAREFTDADVQAETDGPFGPVPSKRRCVSAPVDGTDAARALRQADGLNDESWREFGERNPDAEEYYRVASQLGGSTSLSVAAIAEYMLGWNILSHESGSCFGESAAETLEEAILHLRRAKEMGRVALPELTSRAGYELARVYERAGMSRGLVEAYREAFDLATQHHSDHAETVAFRLALALQDVGDWSAARGLLEKQDAALAQYELAEIAAQARATDVAFVHLQSCIDRASCTQPELAARAHIFRARLLADRGDIREARHHLLAASRLGCDATATSSRFILGTLEEKVGSVERAEEHYNWVVLIGTRIPFASDGNTREMAHLRLGRILAATGRQMDAESHLIAAACRTYSETDTVARVELARTWLRDRMSFEHPDGSDFLTGLQYFLSGDRELARARFERTLVSCKLPEIRARAHFAVYWFENDSVNPALTWFGNDHLRSAASEYLSAAKSYAERNQQQNAAWFDQCAIAICEGVYLRDESTAIVCSMARLRLALWEEERGNLESAFNHYREVHGSANPLLPCYSYPFLRERFERESQGSLRARLAYDEISFAASRPLPYARIDGQPGFPFAAWSPVLFDETPSHPQELSREAASWALILARTGQWLLAARTARVAARLGRTYSTRACRDLVDYELQILGGLKGNVNLANVEVALERAERAESWTAEHDGIPLVESVWQIFRHLQRNVGSAAAPLLAELCVGKGLRALQLANIGLHGDASVTPSFAAAEALARALAMAGAVGNYSGSTGRRLAHTAGALLRGEGTLSSIAYVDHALRAQLLAATFACSNGEEDLLFEQWGLTTEAAIDLMCCAANTALEELRAAYWELAQRDRSRGHLELRAEHSTILRTHIEAHLRRFYYRAADESRRTDHVMQEWCTELLESILANRAMMSLVCYGSDSDTAVSTIAQPTSRVAILQKWVNESNSGWLEVVVGLGLRAEVLLRPQHGLTVRIQPISWTEGGLPETLHFWSKLHATFHLSGRCATQAIAHSASVGLFRSTSEQDVQTGSTPVAELAPVVTDLLGWFGGLPRGTTLRVCPDGVLHDLPWTAMGASCGVPIVGQALSWATLPRSTSAPMYGSEALFVMLPSMVAAYGGLSLLEEHWLEPLRAAGWSIHMVTVADTNEAEAPRWHCCQKRPHRSIKADLVVWITHGDVEPNRPMPWLALHGSQRVTGDDLMNAANTGRRIALGDTGVELDLSNCSAFLSGACMSGRIDPRFGPEGVGLVRGLMALGVRQVFAPCYRALLTCLPDGTHPMFEMMRVMIQAVRDGEPIGAALHEKLVDWRTKQPPQSSMPWDTWWGHASVFVK